MAKRRDNTRLEKETPFDHVAVAFLNALIALPTGLVLWALLNGAPVKWIGWLGWQSVGWFVVVATAVGVVVKQVWLANFYAWLWRKLVRAFQAGVES